MSEHPESSSHPSNNGLIMAIVFASLVIGASVSFLAFQMYQQNSVQANLLDSKGDIDIEKLIAELDLENNGAPPSAPTPPAAPEITASEEAIVGDDPFMGSNNAPVTIVEFSDYQCPFCQRHTNQTLPLIKENYVDTGKVKYVYRDFPLGFHAAAGPAAEAANCAREQGGDKVYFDMHTIIFDAQNKLGSAVLSELFSGFASGLGLDVASFDTCFSSGKYKSEVENDYAEGSQFGVSGTPGFVLIGADGSKKVISGAQPYSVFKNEIDAAL
ncbi:MAG: DsbA family protein [Candidatus Gracilibacteria bacterium]|nr:DsbA family protein [Candidatus Gracilibacteria bacterium]